MKVEDVMAGRKMATLLPTYQGAISSLVNGHQRVYRAAATAYMFEGLRQIPGMIRPIGLLLLQAADAIEELNAADDLDLVIEGLALNIFPDHQE